MEYKPLGVDAGFNTESICKRSPKYFQLARRFYSGSSTAFSLQKLLISLSVNPQRALLPALISPEGWLNFYLNCETHGKEGWSLVNIHLGVLLQKALCINWLINSANQEKWKKWAGKYINVQKSDEFTLASMANVVLYVFYCNHPKLQWTKCKLSVDDWNWGIWAASSYCCVPKRPLCARLGTWVVFHPSPEIVLYIPCLRLTGVPCMTDHMCCYRYVIYLFCFAINAEMQL